MMFFSMNLIQLFAYRTRALTGCVPRSEMALIADVDLVR